VFSICLPAISAGDTMEIATDAGLEAATEGSKSGTIVLIEDDAAVANAQAALLEAEGYRVAIAASAKEAQALAQHLDVVPDLIITDYNLLDGSTGVEAVAAMRELFGASIPAFVVTGDTSVVVEQTKGLPNSVLIRKPVNPDQLLRDADAAIENGEVNVN